MKKIDHDRKAMELALKLLKFRGRSEQDLAEQLVKKGFTKAEAAGTVARLRELKIMDDEALARLWADGARREGHGDIRIRHDLGKRGIPRDIIARVLTVPTEERPLTEAERAREVLSRRVKRLITSGLDPKALTRRLGGHLIRQGFSEEIVREVVDGFLGRAEETPGGEPEDPS